MRIGIFSECYVPVLNGVVVSINTFIDELEKKGHQFFIFTCECPGYPENDPHIKRLKCLLPFKPKGGKYPIARPQNVNKLASNIKNLNLDLIHSQHLLNTGALGLKVARKLDIPAVLTYHTLMTEYVHYLPIIGSSLKSWIINKSKKYCNQYDAIVTPSPSMKKLLISYGVKKPIFPIPTGIDIEKFKNQYTKENLKEKFNIPQNHNFIFLYVSRIGKEKNIYFLLESAKKLMLDRNQKNIHLLLVGGGDELEDAKKLVQRWNLSSQITFTGSLPHDETIKVFGGADAFVFSSVTETQGIIIQEAQASGLPVIALNIMGPGDYIKDGRNGLLSDLNIDEFTDKMELISKDNDLRKKLSENAKTDVKEFTAEKSALKMEKLYEETISNYNRSRQVS